jgi:hypothetical protein
MSRDQFRAPKGQTVTARGGTPGTTPHKVLRALKGHTGQGACGQRSPRWGEVSWHGMTQGSAPLHLGLSPCAALRRERARDACPEDAAHDPPRGEFRVSREQFPELTAGNREPATYAGGVAAVSRVGANAPTRGCCALKGTHPEGGAKIPAPCCNPFRVGDLFRRFPGYRFATPGYPLQRLRRTDVGLQT